ncbi:MAG: protein kinase domain-containing protein [Porticoccaceae bacterium]
MTNNYLKVLQKAHSPLKANVYLDATTEPASVIKDYSFSPSWLRKTMCRIMRNREIRTLKALAGIPGIPAFLGIDSQDSYRMEYIDGLSPDHEFLGTTPGLLSQLSKIVDQMHDRGITHNDLRPNNLIITPKNEVYLIDFGAVAYRPKSNSLWTWPGHWFFNYLCNTDNSKVARLKADFRPMELTELDKELITKTRIARKTTKWWKKFVLPVISPSKHKKDKTRN